jgi:hypothetical protein
LLSLPVVGNTTPMLMVSSAATARPEPEKIAVIPQSSRTATGPLRKNPATKIRASLIVPPQAVCDPNIKRPEFISTMAGKYRCCMIFLPKQN